MSRKNYSSNSRSLFEASDDEELQALKGANKRNKEWNNEEEFGRQQKDIEELSEQVSVVNQMTGMIYDQIVQSSKDLTSLNEDMEQNQTRLEQITSRTKRMVDKAGGPRYCCVIVTLSIIAFVLFLLVLYT